MTIYQVLDEENNLYGEYVNLENAVRSAQTFTLWNEDHYYHVGELKSEPD